jgi:hypothetical protein
LFLKIGSVIKYTSEKTDLLNQRVQELKIQAAIVGGFSYCATGQVSLRRNYNEHLNKVINYTQNEKGNEYPNINKMKCRSESMDKNKGIKPNVSGSFQVIEDDRKETIEELRKDNKLDEETEYYARVFMEE